MDRPSRWAVQNLLEKAWKLHREGRHAESLQAADEAREGATARGDVGLEIKAAAAQALALYMLGEKAMALSRTSFILGEASDPSRRVEVERAEAMDRSRGTTELRDEIQARGERLSEIEGPHASPIP